MPSSVILTDTSGTVGMIKIPGQIKAQHAAEPQRDQTVSLKIEQQLYGISGGAHPGKGSGDTLKSHGPDIMPEDCHSIRNQNLEGQSCDDEGQTVFDLFCSDPAPADLNDGLMICRDGPDSSLGNMAV